MTKTRILNTKFTSKLKRTHPQLAKYPIPTILRQYHEFLLQKVCEERDGIILPGIGAHMFIGVFKASKKYCEKRLIEEEGSTKRGIEIQSAKRGWKTDMEEAYQNYNVHDRDGYEARIMYSIVKLRHRNKDAKYWGFIPTSDTRAACTKAFKQEWKKYIFIPNIRYIEAVYRRESGRKKVSRDVKYIEQKKGHNEFIFDDDIPNIE